MVLCLESTDVPFAGSVDNLRVTGELNDVDGVVTIGVRGIVAPDHAWPYSMDTPQMSAETQSVQLLPYYSWANCGPSSMRVWLPTEGDAVAV